jgi:hypothetical protein
MVQAVRMGKEKSTAIEIKDDIYGQLELPRIFIDTGAVRKMKLFYCAKCKSEIRLF